ncbi:MAG: hypothetical protein N2035_04120 [Chthoniobacterales bacterium]|nr:hypothetical protein [Chthoniobacterales bacterium]MCX7712835.1 hypothetical protein [Chthoniobacterales bacterium]
MKKILFSLFVFFGIAGFGFTSDGNLIPEGSFEILNAAGNPEGWKLPDPNWYKNFGGKVRIINEEGDNFLQIESDGMDKLLRASFKVTIPDNVARLRLSYRIRADVRDVASNEDKKGVGVQVARWWGNNEKEEAKWGGADWVTASTGGWVDKEFEFDVPAGMTTLRIDIGIRNASAIADFNDIQLVPVN